MFFLPLNILSPNYNAHIFFVRQYGISLEFWELDYLHAKKDFSIFFGKNETVTVFLVTRHRGEVLQTKWRNPNNPSWSDDALFCLSASPCHVIAVMSMALTVVFFYQSFGQCSKFTNCADVNPFTAFGHSMHIMSIDMALSWCGICLAMELRCSSNTKKEILFILVHSYWYCCRIKLCGPTLLKGW